MSVLVDNQIPAYGIKAAVRSAERAMVPTKPWADLCNSYRCTIGPTPGRAYLILRKADLDKLVLTQTHELTFDDTNQGKVVIKAMAFVRATRILRGTASDLDHLYFAEFADPRWFAKNPYFAVPINRSYNVRAPAAGQTYYADSLNAGSAWTWQQMLDDVWGLLAVADLGAAPQLPATPDGTPENFRFQGVSAWQAYNDILDRLGVVFSWDPHSAVSALYAQPASDSAHDAAVQQHATKLIWDNAPVVNGWAVTPEKVRVYHPTIREHYGTEKSTDWATGNQDTLPILASADQTAPAALTVRAGTLGGVLDDLPSIKDFAGAVTNAAAITTRDTARGTDYYTTLQGVGLQPRVLIYSGCLTNADLVQPKGYVTGVCWRYGPGGYTTEVVRYPPWTPPDAVKFADDGAWSPFGGGDDAALNLRPPDLARTTFPVYPPLTHLVQIQSATTVATNVYDAKVVRVNPSDRSLNNAENCWFFAADGIPLQANDVVLGRLNGSATFTASQRGLYVAAGRGARGAWAKCLGASPTSGRYDARLQVEQADGTLADTGPSIWLRDANDCGLLVLNNIYHCHKTGNTSGRDVYTAEDFNAIVRYDDLSSERTRTLYLELEDTDFIHTAPGTRRVKVTTNGFSGTVGPFYKYACSGTSLVQYTSAGFPSTRGLVKDQIAAYA